MNIRIGLMGTIAFSVCLILTACILPQRNKYADVPIMDGALHTTQEGETLGAIAKAYDVSVPLIRRVNNVKEISALPAGTRLFIPGAEDVVSVAVTRETSITEKPDGLYHPVKPGHTLSLIAKAYEITMKELQEVNNIYDPNEIQAGDQVWIPRAKEVEDVELPVITIVSNDPVPTKKADPRVNVVIKPTPTPQPKLPNATPTPVQHEFPRKINTIEDIDFQWPIKTNFQIIQDYNPSKQSSGIDFGGSIGTPIYSVADGTVDNVGGINDLLGDPYGNYIIIHHGDVNGKSFRSIYGHNQKNSVEKGQKVKRGDQIAEMGNTGKPVTKDSGILHFEFRHEFDAKNPREILPALQ